VVKNIEIETMKRKGQLLRELSKKDIGIVGYKLGVSLIKDM